MTAMGTGFIWLVMAIAAAEQAAGSGPFLHGAVAADHPLASAAGVEILQHGGNVVDAAVATAFTLSVVRPASSGLGGGGFLLYWDAATQRAYAYDYRERAPLAATADLFRPKDGRPNPDISQHGGLAIAVPGHVPGLTAILKQHGRLPLEQVLEPALRHAREGVVIDPVDRDTQRSVLAQFSKRPELQSRYQALWEGYLNRGRPWNEGDRFFSPQRAALESLSTHGPATFVDGEIAQLLIAESQRRGGLLALPDLARMAPVERQPLSSRYHGYDVLTMPPPSSGGIALLQTLHMLEAWERQPGHSPWKSLAAADRWQVLTEAWKHAFADRAEYLGDADVVAVPVAHLLSRSYAARQAAKIDLKATKTLDDYGRSFLTDDAGTTHFCVMDALGNAVACTETINTTFGSYVVEPKFGIVLNNEMDDFTAVPGQPNAFGLTQSAANAVAPGKKPLSSMTPTIVLKDGKPRFIVGASGGPRIITATTQVLLLMMDFDQSANDAVTQPRGHHQWMPHELLMEPDLFREVGERLQARGHTVRSFNQLAATQALRWTSAGIDAGSDPRKHGRPAGW